MVTHGYARTKKSPEYRAWVHMHQRCKNPKNASYQYYGGSGIKVCERWNDFASFLADVGNRPTSAHSLDRLDSSGDYTPENCKWSTPAEQSRNRRGVIKLTINGVSLCMQEWSVASGTGVKAIRYRLGKGWSHEEAVYGKGGGGA